MGEASVMRGQTDLRGPHRAHISPAAMACPGFAPFFASIARNDDRRVSVEGKSLCTLSTMDGHRVWNAESWLNADRRRLSKVKVGGYSSTYLCRHEIS